MTPDEYARLDATDLAGLVAAGEVTPAQLHMAATARHEQTDETLNAVVEWYADPTPSTGAGPLAGVPFLCKDYGSAEAGRLVEMGSRLAAGLRCEHTGEYVRRLQRAGATIVGRSAVPEFIQHGTTESVAHGATRNPWNPAYSAGGSSGGAAAAVAAGVVPAAHASDCAGSIRIPAATCGLVGLKPGRRRVPWEGGGWGGIAEEFVVTRTARDAQLYLDVLGDERQPSTPVIDRPLRIALSNEHWAGATEDPAIHAATDEFAGRLEELGHHVEPVTMPFDQDALMELWHPLFSRWVAHDVVNAAARSGRPVDADHVEFTTLLLLDAVAALGVDDITDAQVLQGLVTTRLHRELAGHDLLLSPALGRTAIELGTLAGSADSMDAYLEAGNATMPYSWLFNVTGWAAASIPTVRLGPEGLPLGVQLAGPIGTEGLILDLAVQLEAATASTAFPLAGYP